MDPDGKEEAPTALTKPKPSDLQENAALGRGRQEGLSFDFLKTELQHFSRGPKDVNPSFELQTMTRPHVVSSGEGVDNSLAGDLV